MTLHRDLSLWVLLFFNSVTIFYAVEKNWSLETIMMVYLVQNLIIGVFSFIKIYTVKNFKVPEGLEILGNPMSKMREDVRKSAFTFTFAYSFFHALYLLIVVRELRKHSRWVRPVNNKCFHTTTVPIWLSYEYFQRDSLRKVYKG